MALGERGDPWWEPPTEETPEYKKADFKAAMDAAISRGWTSISEQWVNPEKLDNLLMSLEELGLEIRADLPRFSDWPTFPQLFINGEFIGGCDITVELFESGELARMVAEAQKAA